MKICVVGAGAIGGLLAAKLALAGNDVTAIDQGVHLEAIQKNGLKLIWEDGSEHIAQLRAVGSAAEAAPVIPVAPAIANAIYAAVGVRVRDLPIRLS